MGNVIIDLSEAEFDDWEVEIVVHTTMGWITVIAPSGVDVRQVGGSGAVRSNLEPPIPGFPVVRLSASCDMGTIRVMHPKEKGSATGDAVGDAAEQHPDHGPTAASSARHEQGGSSSCGCDRAHRRIASVVAFARLSPDRVPKTPGCLINPATDVTARPWG